jgi:hypothetical protein
MKKPALNRRTFLRNTVATAAGCSLVPGLARAAVEGGPAAAAVADDSLAGAATGPWRRLFLDAAVCERHKGLERMYHAAQKHPSNPLIRADKPWESPGAINGPYVYGTILRENGKLKLWYQVLNQGNHVAYAESLDGIAWTKPELGIIAFKGSKANNLVVSAFQPEVTGGTCHNPSVIRCPGAIDPARRYALYGFDGAAGHARVAFSPDGLHWTYVPETEKKALFTSSDVVNFFHDPYQKRYAATWKTRNRRGRAVGVAWSLDSLAWSKPFDGPVFVADDLDPDATQVYGMPAFPYQGLYIGLPWLYDARYFKYGEYSVKKLHEAQEDSPRTMRVELAWSWDLINWTRPPARPDFIPLGARGAWDDGMIVTARAPVLMGDNLYFYYGGCDNVHDEKRVNAAIGLATLRLDGFCSMRAGNEEGWLITRREPFRDPSVTINARTQREGFVAAEILDRHDRVLAGFSRADCEPFSGDSTAHTLRWKLPQFAGNQKADDYKIRLWLKNADLFSYLPGKLDPSQPDLARVQRIGP